MSGVVRFVAGVALMFTGIFTGNLALAKAGYYLGMSGLIEEAAKLFLPKPPKTRIRQDVEYAGTVEPRRIIYGELRVGGMNTIRPIVAGASGQFLYQVLTVAGHEVDDITDVWFNQDLIADANIAAVTGAAGDGAVTSGKYQNQASIRRYLGTSTQAADWKLVNEGPSGFWTTAHQGRGVAYLALTFTLKEKLFGSGKPEVSCKVRGKKCYDPRLDSSPGANPTTTAYKAWTKNPALQLADYLTDADVGRGISPLKIDWDLVVTAANICDENVAIPGSTTQDRYTCSVVLDATGVRPEDNIKALAGAMLGVCYRQGGKWRMYAGTDQTPSFTMTEANIVGAYTFRHEMPMGEKYNYVRGTFMDSARNYMECEYEPRASATYEAADGLRLPKDAPFLTCTDQWEAQRNSIILSRRSRMSQTLTARFDLAAFNVRPFMVGTMTLAEMGWNAQRVVCLSWEFIGDGTIELMLQEDAATIWDDPATGDYSTPGSGMSGSSDSYTPDPPSSLTATSIPNGILFTWELPVDWLSSDVVELWEYTASTPFASATRIWQGRTSATIIPKTDTTTRYYWIRTRAFNDNASATVPSASGVAGRALTASATLAATPSVSTLSDTDTTSSITTPSVTVAATGGTPGYTYAWTKLSGGTISITSSSSASTTFSATGLTSGESRTAIFRCTVTDSVAGTATCDVTVTITRSAFSASASPTSLSATGTGTSVTTASATVTPAGGVAPYSYSWAKVSGGTITATSPTSASSTFSATGLASGESRTAVFRCTVTDSTSGTPLTATADVSITITRSAAMTVALTPTSLTKQGTSPSLTTASVTALASNGVGPYSYAWAYVSGDSFTINSPSAATTTFSKTGAVVGTAYSGTYRCTATDSTGGTPLTATADIVVTIERLETEG